MIAPSLHDRHAHHREVAGPDRDGVDLGRVVLRLVVAADAHAFHVDVGRQRQTGGDGGARSRPAARAAPPGHALAQRHRALEVVAVHLQVEVEGGHRAPGRSRGRCRARRAGPRASSAPATSSTSDSASWVTTSASRSVTRRRTEPSPVASAFRDGTRSSLDAVSAGARPNSIVVTSETAGGEGEHGAVQAEVEMDGHRQPVGGQRRSGSAPAQAASSTPSAPPMAASTRLSLRSWRTRRPRLGADRGAHRQLAPPRGAAGEQHVGDVGAGDGQHERDRGQQHRARAP